MPPFENQRASGQDILLPQQTKSSRKRKTILLEINSRDRNVTMYPKSSQFRWTPFRPLKDIYSIQLVGGTIPTRIFNITDAWNKFTFQEGTTQYTLTLTPGRYTTVLFTAEFSSKLNALSGISNTYTISILDTTDQFVITRSSGSDSFALLFSSGSYVDLKDTIKTPRRLLGFSLQDYTNTNTTITSPYAMDLDFLVNRLYLFINHDNAQNLGTIERSLGKSNPHAILYMDSNDTPYKTFTKDTFQPVFESHAISRMNALDISIRDEFDNLIEFNGRDFTLLMEFVYLE